MLPLPPSQQEPILALRAREYLERLCLQYPHRRVGSSGNRAATAYAAQQLAPFGFHIEQPEFACLDWEQDGAFLSVQDEQYIVFASPYSLSCKAQAPLVVVSSIEELEIAIENKLLLVRGELAREQLMPKNFPFYRPDEHLRIIQLLEEKRPLGIIAATSRNPELVGGVYPFPLIEDGDFDIPSAFMTEEEGNRLASRAGQEACLEIRARRIPASGCSVLARKGTNPSRRIVICAHIDAKEGTPGALDNASGVVVLLLLAELLRDYQGSLGIEIFVINGEDHYSAAGEIQYLQANQGRMGEIFLAINLDMVGDCQGKTHYSFYGCPEETAQVLRAGLSQHPDILEGDPWYQGDHMVFFQSQVPAVALTSSRILELMTEITHTERDVPGLVDPFQLVGIAQAIKDIIDRLNSDVQPNHNS